MPENMFQRFSTGAYNPKSLGIRHIRALTESRGVKEGNNALTKDIEMLDFSRANKHSLRPFFKLLFNLAFEYGISNDLYDFLLAKCKHQKSKKKRKDFIKHKFNLTKFFFLKGNRPTNNSDQTMSIQE